MSILNNFDDYVQYIIIAVIAIIYLIRILIEFIISRDTNKLKKQLKEAIQTMVNYRVLNTKEYESEKKPKQSFTRFTDRYKLNPETNELEKLVNPETGEVLQDDNQAYIESFSNTALDKVLEKFLPSEYYQTLSPISDSQFDDKLDSRVTDLSDYSAILDLAEDYREKYNLDSDMTCVDVFNFVENLNTRYKDRVKGMQDVLKTKTLKTGKIESNLVQEHISNVPTQLTLDDILNIVNEYKKNKE